MNKGLTINFDCNFIININEVSLENILTAFKEFLPQILTQFIMNILLGYAEYIMQKKEKPFVCNNCGNNHEFTWKTKHGKPTKILTILWSYLLAELIEICAIRPLVDDLRIIENMVKSKLLRLEKLIHFCRENGFTHSAEYLENAKGDMFTAITNRLHGKTTSKVKRVMRTVNLRVNVGKWSQAGALNATKIRLAYYYNGFDV